MKEQFVKNQHYVPQSFLRNFASRVSLKNGKVKDTFVYVRFRGEKFHEVNVRNICSEKDFYELETGDIKHKNQIENFYGQNIDGLYSRIIQIAKNESTEPTDGERGLILFATLSLFSRTLSAFEYIENEYSTLIENLKSYHLGKSERYNTSYLGRTFDLRTMPFEATISNFEQKRKAVLILEHFSILKDLILHFQHSDISICRAAESTKFITSDNPVVFRNMKTGQFYSLFDPENIVHMAISDEYKITIYPKGTSSSPPSIQRSIVDAMNVICTNYDLERNSKNWIIGRQETIDDHIEDQLDMLDWSPKNIAILDKIIEKASLMKKMDEAVLNSANISAEDFLAQLVELGKHDVMKDDINLLDMLKRFRAYGYNC